MTSRQPHESTPESLARHGTSAPASIDEDDTPEGRLRARKGSAQYRADVEALIHERDTLEAEVAGLRRKLREESSLKWSARAQAQKFGTIRTGVLEE